VLVVAHLAGLATSLHALMTVRTPQGTVAWVVSLNAMPLLAVPAYLVFGRSKFEGYVIQRRSVDLLADLQEKSIAERLEPMVPDFARHAGAALAGQRLADLPYLGGNEVELLVDGEATFASLLAGIDRARKYVLIQFYIVRDDRIGRELRDRLAAKARSRRRAVRRDPGAGQPLPAQLPQPLQDRGGRRRGGLGRRAQCR
jgi:cardiolipin synthase